MTPHARHSLFAEDSQTFVFAGVARVRNRNRPGTWKRNGGFRRNWLRRSIHTLRRLLAVASEAQLSFSLNCNAPTVLGRLCGSTCGVVQGCHDGIRAGGRRSNRRSRCFPNGARHEVEHRPSRSLRMRSNPGRTARRVSHRGKRAAAACHAGASSGAGPGPARRVRGECQELLPMGSKGRRVWCGSEEAEWVGAGYDTAVHQRALTKSRWEPVTRAWAYWPHRLPTGPRAFRRQKARQILFWRVVARQGARLSLFQIRKRLSVQIQNAASRQQNDPKIHVSPFARKRSVAIVCLPPWASPNPETAIGNLTSVADKKRWREQKFVSLVEVYYYTVQYVMSSSVSTQIVPRERIA